MDEIDWKKSIIKGIKFTSGCFLGFVAVFVILSVIGYFTNGGNTYYFEIMRVFLIIPVIIIALELILLAVVYIIGIYDNRGKKVIIWKKEYIREIQKEYTPAIISLLYDLKTEVYKDYTATILNLYLKKYIVLIQEEPRIMVRNICTAGLYEHEIYVLQCLKGEEKFDEVRFKDLIIKDAKDKELIIEETINKFNKYLGIGLIYAIITGVSFFINNVFFIVMIVIGFILYIYSIIKGLSQEYTEKYYKRTKKGTEVAIYGNSLKRFLKEYTLIQEREIDYVKLLEEYIPYALSLDEADNIEEFIKENEVYRNLIYNQK